MKQIKKGPVLMVLLVLAAAATAFASDRSEANIRWETIQDHSLGYSLVYPAQSWEARLVINNDGTLPLEAMRRRVTLFGPDRAEINIDAWHNPQHLTAGDWFEQVLGWVWSFPDLQIDMMGGSVDQEPAITFIQPRIGQGISSRSTVFLHGDLAYRVEYVEYDGSKALATYESVLDGFRFIPIREPLTWIPEIPEGPPRTSAMVPEDCNCNPGPCSNCCGISDPDNPFPCCNGNCTWYARYRWDHTGPQPRPHGLSACYGNAWEWYPQAVNAGYAVGTTPACDSIAIYQPYVCQHGWCTLGLGHVAYVTQVSGDDFVHGSIGWDNDCVYGEANGSKDATANPTTGHSNVAFIYHTSPCCCGQNCSSSPFGQGSSEQACAPSSIAADEADEADREISNPVAPVSTSASEDVHPPVTAPTRVVPRLPELIPVESQRTPPASANYRIAKSVFGSGGGPKASASYRMNSTQGQSTDLSLRESASYVLVPGYWSSSGMGHRIYLPLIVKGY